MEKFVKNGSFHASKRLPESKLKHLDACLLEASQYKKSAGFDELELINESTAGLSINDISLETKLFDFRLNAPLMIAPMTGGMKRGARLNRLWAKAAQHFGIAMGVGSQRLALEDKTVAKSFQIRQYAPDIFIFANLGAGQLCAGYSPHHALEAVKMIEANALFIHLNPLQELCQENGDRDFSKTLCAIKKVVTHLHKHGIKVFVREVSFGLSKKAVVDLLSTGIDGFDCTGAGGTSWAKVEGLCAKSAEFRRLGNTFGEWGIKTTESIKNVRAIDKSIPLIATGGIRNGLDVAKAIALGADVAAMARPMLLAATISEEALITFIRETLQQLRIAMLASGCKKVKDLRKAISVSSL